ncbi:MAG TPA: Ig-like domain-containing protein [Niastella sp.]
MFSFTGTVSGGATWADGVRIQNDPTVGDYIYVQPTNASSNTPANFATYTFQFAEAVTNFSLRCAGLNNNDQLRITAFNGATPITITAANFSDNVADPGNAGVITITGGNTITGANTAGGTAVTTNRITLTIPGPVTRIVMNSSKSTNTNSTVTLGFTSVSYTRCINVRPDINATFVNTSISGNVGTNDTQPTGTTYGTATALPGNPGPAVPTINSNGTYTFTSAVAGIFKFTVPMCPGSVVTPDCANVNLTITVSDANGFTNKPFANTDLATTPINTAVTLKTLANDKAGNNTAVTLNPASVAVTVAPLHGTTSVNSSTGAITYTPTTNYTGYDTLTYQVCDTKSPTPQCASAYQIITVIPVSATNSTMASDDYNSTPLNTNVSGNIKDNDSDPENNTQTVTAQTTNTPGKGTLTLLSNGNYTFAPANGFTGPINYTYQTCDNGSPAACTNATLYMLVFPSATLPLELLSFTAVANNGNGQLTWRTAAQDNVNRFEIERSSPSPLSYTTVGTVPVNNGTTGTYYFTDAHAGDHVKTGIYRLKIIDNDGRFKYSQVRTINFESQQSSTVRPTTVAAGEPVTLFAAASTNQGRYTGQLYNSFGQLLQEWTGATDSFRQIETANLRKGMYFIKVIQQTGSTTEKFVVQ